VPYSLEGGVKNFLCKWYPTSDIPIDSSEILVTKKYGVWGYISKVHGVMCQKPFFQNVKKSTEWRFLCYNFFIFKKRPHSVYIKAVARVQSCTTSGCSSLKTFPMRSYDHYNFRLQKSYMQILVKRLKILFAFKIFFT
jgi:hypothetical protein